MEAIQAQLDKLAATVLSYPQQPSQILFCNSSTNKHKTLKKLCNNMGIIRFAEILHICKSKSRYSSPRLVEDWMEELIVGLLLVENAWCQKQSWSFMHLLCSGMVGFGLRRKLGTAGTERDSPLVLPPWPGGILILLAGFVLFSTVVFLGDLEIYFFVPVSRQ